MKIDKVINNNIISSFDECGREIVVMGRGLGFKKKPGQEVDDQMVEKVFRMDDKAKTDHLKSLLSQMPIEHIQISNDIITYAKVTLGKELNKSIYITLTDHINFAIERNSKGHNFQNALLWEIKKFYHSEYQIGLHGVQLINEKLGINLPEDEAGSIALHIVNAEFNTKMDNAMDITKLIQEVIKIVKYHYTMEINEDTIHYERFVTHLKFFAQRLFEGKMLKSADHAFLNMIQLQYKKDFECTQKIKEYIEKEYACAITEEEQVYLAVHIHRITSPND